MKQLLSLVTIASLILLSSCRKDSTLPVDDTNPVVVKRLKHSTVANNSTLTYNSDGTPKNINYVNAWGSYDKVFSYQPGMISYVVKTSSNPKEQEIDMVLTNGKVTQTIIRTFDSNGDLLATSGDQITYNAKGLEEKRTYTSGNYTICIYDNNNNLIEYTNYNAQGQATEKSVYTYYAKKDLYPWFGFWSASGARFFMPAYSRDLLKSQITTDLTNGQVKLNGIIEYEFDTDGYVIKGTWKDVGGSGSWSWVNTYES